MSERPYNKPDGIRVLICGGRDFNDAMTFGSWVGGVMRSRGIATIIEGGARGADYMARRFGEWANVPVQSFPADWRKHGKGAGPIRNRQMLTEGRPDLVLAFEGGSGTADMVRQARAAGVEVFEASKVSVQ